MIKKIFPSADNLELKARIWIEADNERFLGPGPVELLEKIMELGSISKAASAMGMSYQKAWTIINTLNSKAIRPLVTAQAGGKRGGGAVVTEDGQVVVQVFKQLQTKVKQFLEENNSLWH
ncbi:winged helix-turn-helix domain-containing protein [Adhaeribacter aquaticus]|uniref:winged helix-turn-helix domain-containing protein n=1 Tax=Adhaeribacter aquaticus TaxID=299567 RepID=UPI000406B621|nr:LysR family transcriptional regulator [Adhaeribacter aquaticus]